MVKRWLGSYYFQMAILLIAAFISYCPSLSSHFLADDMWQVNFAHQVFTGHPELIWRNFTSNYLQIPELVFYRPLLGFTFLFDYAIWKTNPTGYHLTNLLLLFLNAALLFAVVRQLTRGWPALNAHLASFGGGLLFIATPLHIEAVTWISGRADLLCGVFYLCSLYFFIRHLREDDKKFYFLLIALLSFWLALLSKEIAIGLPLVATAAWLLLFRQPNKCLPVQTDQPVKPFAFFKLKPFKALVLLFLSVPIYLFIRQLALGTVYGGYTATLGQFLEGDLLARWSSPLFIEKALLPIPESVTTSYAPHWIMALCLLLILLLAVFRLFLARGAMLRLIAFLCMWMVSTLVPLFNVWGTGTELQGSRLLFFASMAYSAFWPIVLFHPPAQSSTEKIHNQVDRDLCRLGIPLIVIMISIMTWTTMSTNRIWYQGGGELQSIVEKTVETISKIPPDHRIVLLAVPQDYKGVPIIYDAFTFYQLFRPPFRSQSVADKLVTFLPSVPGGSSEIVNANRLRRIAVDASTEGIYFWNTTTKTLDKVDPFFSKTNPPPPIALDGLESAQKPVPYSLLNLEKASVCQAGKNSRRGRLEAGKVIIDNVQDGDYLEFGDLDLPPFPFDYIRLRILVRQPTPTKGKRLAVSWLPKARSNFSSEQKVVFPPTRNEEFTFHIRVSKNQEWFASQQIEKLRLSLFESDRVEISEVMVLSGNKIFPNVDISGTKQLSSGQFVFDGRPVEVAYSAAVPDCEQVELLISKPNYCFDYNYWRTESIQESVRGSAPSGRITLSDNLFQKCGYYQVAARALSKDGSQIGDWSDSVTLFKPGNELEQYLF